MIDGISPLAQATLGTLFTWGLTAAGAGVVVIFQGTQRWMLDSSLGFAAGVMMAASFWSLLAPAIEMASESKTYGQNGEYAFAPVALGFFLGGLFVYLTDLLISSFGLCAPHLLLAMENDVKKQMKKHDSAHRDNNSSGLPLEDLYESNPSRRRTVGPENHVSETNFSTPVIEHQTRPYTVFSSSDPTSLNYYHINNATVPLAASSFGNPRTRNITKTYPRFNLDQRRSVTISNPQNVYEMGSPLHAMEGSVHQNSDSAGTTSKGERGNSDQWKRIVLLIVAITVHNIPEGLAVGVGFGAIGSASSATFENARNLAIGIGIQNFPEGLAVSLPLRAAGFSLWRSFWYGQLSGMVEPIFGILGALAVSLAKPLLPYALAFAAGAMIYVVVDDIIPEANSCDNGKLATWGTILGFTVMMVLDVGLGG